MGGSKMDINTKVGSSKMSRAQIALLRRGWALAVFLAPIVFQGFGQLFMVRILAVVGLYVMLALGLNIVVGYAGLLDLGYIAFYAIGAYAGVLARHAVLRVARRDVPGDRRGCRASRTSR